MVKRLMWKRYAYLAFAFLVMMMCWESNRSNVMFALAMSDRQAQEAGQAIPQESIRLRILANSDAPGDQWIKREVRDAVVEQMNGWVTGPQGIDEARAVVREHLPELEALVGATLRNNGFDYSYKVELGVVPFPTKMYGNVVYPAGDYEALRVSIGKAEGQNWWCVLFPPLCFVDSEMVVKKNVASAAPAEEEGASASKAGEKKGAKPAVSAKGKPEAVKAKADGKPASAVKTVESDDSIASAASAKPEVRFFLWDLLKKIGSWFA